MKYKSTFVSSYFQRNTGTAAILVKVQDVEDQPPEFVAVSSVTRVSEDVPVGTSVLQGKIAITEE
jgi:hypothetical protein